MAFSAQEGKGFFSDWLIHFAKPLNFTRFLDVGAGAGWYCDLIRIVFGREVQVDAVEIFPEYITRHNLKPKYDRIFMEDIREVHGAMENYDLIIMGDVIEHMTKAEAIETVWGLSNKCRFLWAALPLKMGRLWSTGYKQGAEEWQENKFNEHLHEWTGIELLEEFNPLWIVPFVQTGCFLMEGGLQ